MPIKDKSYWKEYNQKRKERGYFQQNYQTRKEQVVKSEIVVKSLQSEEVVKNPSENILQPTKEDNFTTDKTSPEFLQPNQVVKNESLQPTEILQPNFSPHLSTPEIILEKVKELLFVYNRECIEIKEQDKTARAKRHYQYLLTYLKWVENKEIRELQNQLAAVATLPTAYIDNRETELKEKHRKEVEKLETQIKELQKPINPTIELWRNRFLDLQKEYHQKGNEQAETIKRLKEKLREQYKTIGDLQKQAKNNNNSLSMPNLYSLIEKHKNFQSIQRIYSPKEVKEREFLKSLLDKLWSFAG